MRIYLYARVIKNGTATEADEIRYSRSATICIGGVAFILGLMAPHFESAVRDHAMRRPALVAYRDRGLALWYPDLRMG